MMFWNSWIGFINETYLFLGVCSAINFFYFFWNTAGNVFNSGVSLLFAVVLVLFPFFVAFFYNSNESFTKIIHRNTIFWESYGSVLEQLNFWREGKIVLLNPVA